jgi:hypothetical protein
MSIGTVELTLANTVPAMAELIPLAEQTLADAERAIDGVWVPVPLVASGIPRGGRSTPTRPGDPGPLGPPLALAAQAW